MNLPDKSRKLALVTGATGGIGQHIVENLVRQRIQVLATGRNERKLAQLALFSGVTVIQCDLLNSNAINNFLAIACGSEIDILVNCAGRGLLSDFANSTNESNLEISSINFSVPLKITHALLPKLIQRQGKILNFASLASFFPLPNLAILSSSKAALLNWSVALHHEVKSLGVSVTAFCPGITQTAFLSTARMEHLSLGKNFLAHQPNVVAVRSLAALNRNKSIAYVNQLDHCLVAIGQLLPPDVVSSLARRLLRPQVSNQDFTNN